MTLRITLIVDESEGEEFVGVIAKALGRGELGILDIRIAPLDERQPKPEPRQDFLIAKLAGVDAVAPKQIGQPKPKGRPKGIKSRRHYAPLSVSDTLHAFLVKRGEPVNWIQLQGELARVGYSSTSINTGVQRLLEEHPDVFKTEDRRYAIKSQKPA